MSTPSVLIVEGDIAVRHPLAEYLRECGFTVFEAADGNEAMQLLSGSGFQVQAVLVDMVTPGGGFGLRQWIKARRPGIDVILAGTVEKAVDQAGDLCNEGPALAKPYEHQFVLDEIRRAIARRERGDG